MANPEQQAINGQPLQPAAAAPGAGPQLSLETASQAESLDQIEGIATSAFGSGGSAAPGAGPVEVQKTNAVLIADTLQTARDMFSSLTQLKAPKAVLTDAECADMGKLWGGWCDRRGIQLGQYMGKHHDTYLAALATVALAVSVYQATAAELALRKPVDVKAKPPQGDQVKAPAPAAPAANDTTATFVGGAA
ncbi:MAG TPA: hypothetical protein VF522_13165 [Ramlibacter sp.]|uniref:hypothetical protein n=1 Tax=Ramlibacter sp. TaxID=1917967 RepID=UPI002ECFAEA1